MALTFPDDLTAWQSWQDRQHLLRWARSHVRSRTPEPYLVSVYGEHRPGALLVAVEATHASFTAAVVEPLRHLDPADVCVLAPRAARHLLPAGLPPESVVALDALDSVIPEPRAVLAAGHFTPIGAAAHALARRHDVPFSVSQHGLLTPFAPPLPREAHLLAWSAADAAFWWSGRPGTTHVVGSQLLERAARRPAPAVDPSHRPTYLGQMHAAELPRHRMISSAFAFCRAFHAEYRPHPSERDRVSRLVHTAMSAGGITIASEGTELRDQDTPVVSVFSTGVLEAAARGLPAWVDFSDPPRWLEEFWERYAMSRFGQEPTPAPARPADEPALAIARILEAL